MKHILLILALLWAPIASAQTDGLGINRTTKRLNRPIVKVPTGHVWTFELGSELDLTDATLTGLPVGDVTASGNNTFSGTNTLQSSALFSPSRLVFDALDEQGLKGSISVLRTPDNDSRVYLALGTNLTAALGQDVVDRSITQFNFENGWDPGPLGIVPTHALTGNVSIASGSKLLSGFAGTIFGGEVKRGETVQVSGQTFVIDEINSASSATVTIAAASTHTNVAATTGWKELTNIAGVFTSGSVAHGVTLTQGVTGATAITNGAQSSGTKLYVTNVQGSPNSSNTWTGGGLTFTPSAVPSSITATAGSTTITGNGSANFLTEIGRNLAGTSFAPRKGPRLVFNSESHFIQSIANDGLTLVLEKPAVSAATNVTYGIGGLISNESYIVLGSKRPWLTQNIVNFPEVNSTNFTGPITAGISSGTKALLESTGGRMLDVYCSMFANQMPQVRFMNATTSLTGFAGVWLNFSAPYANGGNTPLGYIVGINQLVNPITSADSNNFSIYDSTGIGAGAPGFRFFIKANGNVGIGTYSPDVAFDINSATGANLQLTYNDGDGAAVNKVNFVTSSSGDLTITPSGGDFNITGGLTATRATDATTVANGVAVITSTAATLNNQKWSPAIVLSSKGWGTTASTSQDVSFHTIVKPTQGTVPTGSWALQSSVAGSAMTNRLTVDTLGNAVFSGNVTVTDRVVASNMQAGNNIGLGASTYGIRFTTYGWVEDSAGSKGMRTNGFIGFSAGGVGGSADLNISRNAANVLQIGGTSMDATGSLLLTNMTQSGLRATNAAAPTVASATTIAPTKLITFISGTAAIDTITAPSPISAGGGTITLIPTALWTTTTAGNIALASTAVVNRTMTMTYDVTTTKWYPSY